MRERREGNAIFLREEKMCFKASFALARFFVNANGGRKEREKKERKKEGKKERRKRKRKKNNSIEQKVQNYDYTFFPCILRTSARSQRHDYCCLC